MNRPFARMMQDVNLPETQQYLSVRGFHVKDVLRQPTSKIVAIMELSTGTLRFSAPFGIKRWFWPLLTIRSARSSRVKVTPVI